MTEVIDTFAEIKMAHKRAKGMGVAHLFEPAFNSHPLAACISNYTMLLDAHHLLPNPHTFDAAIENYKMLSDEGHPLGVEGTLITAQKASVHEYKFDLQCIDVMAKRINKYCDTHKVKGDKAAEYWLFKFLDVDCRVCSIDVLIKGANG